MNGKTIFAFVLLVAVGIGGYWVGSHYTLVPQQAALIVTTPSLLPSPTVPTIPSPTTDESADIIAGVKTGLVAEHGSSAANMNITISKIEGDYATGGAIDPGAISGGMWLAAKSGGQWKLVWDGNGTISCNALSPYPNFPTDMAPECWDDATQKSVTR